MADTECVTSVHARLVSVHGGLLLGIAFSLSAFLVAAFMAGSLELSQQMLFGLLAIASWIYLLDSVTERVELVGSLLVRRSLFQRRTEISVTDLRQLVLVHEGLNQAVGLESLIVRRMNGEEEIISLGPCWRTRDLQAFIRSVDQWMMVTS